MALNQNRVFVQCGSEFSGTLTKARQQGAITKAFWVSTHRQHLTLCRWEDAAHVEPLSLFCPLLYLRLEALIPRTPSLTTYLPLKTRGDKSTQSEGPDAVF
jgi:hypothetical protein